MSRTRDYDQNDAFYSYTDPIQETSYDRLKTECCHVVFDSLAFIKRLPVASSFLLVLTTLVSLTKAYFGRELVLNRTGNLKSTVSHSQGQLSVHKPRSNSSSRSNEPSPNGHGTQVPHEQLSSSPRQFSNSTSPQLSHKEAQLVGKSSSHSSNHLPPAHASQQHHDTRPTIHTPVPLHRPSTIPSSHMVISLPNQEVEVIHERLQSYAAGSVPSSEALLQHQELLLVAAECLHAQDYGQMRKVLSVIQIDSSTDEEIVLAATFGLGQAHFKLREYGPAETYFTEVDSRARGLGERGKGDVSIANYYLGDIFFVRHKYTEAAQHYQISIDYHSTQVSVAKVFKVIPPTKSGLWAKLAATLRNSGKIVDAVSAYREAIAAATAKKDRLTAHTSLGNLLQNVGDNAKAVDEYKVSIQLSEELADKVSLGWAHGNIGNAYLGMNCKDKAVHHLKVALELTLEYEPTPSAIGRAYNNLGTAYQALNELEQAQEYYDLALAQAIYGGDQAGQARVYGNIGNLQMLLKKYDGSIRHYTETLNTTKDKATKITAHHNRGCASYEKAESDKRKFYMTAFSSLATSTTTDPDSTADQEAKKLFSLTYHGEVLGPIEEAHKIPALPVSIQRRYRKAQDDLSYVVNQHELSFKHIKGSRKGLTLSVSLFETNSRTFHRLLDCLYNLGEWEKALVYAEQSRARTLGELLLERKRAQLDMELVTPLDLRQIDSIVGSQGHDVVVLSYTGSRLLVWILSPVRTETGERVVRRAMFQVTLDENGFEGKSLDYYLHYLLSDELVEKNVEMYAYSDYQSDEHILPTVHLHELFAKPFLRVMSCLHPDTSPTQVEDVIVIPDSYINLLPLVALFNKASQEFLGDRYRFRIMPSLLSMAVMNQMPPVVVHIPRDSNKFCVVGNPTIPIFEVKGKTWSLGKLPFATEEAEWVSYILGCKPTLHEQATKSVVMMMVSSARVIHIATHGSAASGFLAFASLGGFSGRDPVEESSVLIYPEDIERMALVPALVVLSSCDSGRGTVKADGVLGMARAFILAGAQAVMTTLWRVPDESAAVFMKFFYQYLVDGHPASRSLQKAVLSVRSFSKYSGFIHWSGYQLSGREVMVHVADGVEGERAVKHALGGEGPTVFPRLDVVKALEKELAEKVEGDSTAPPTDVKVLHGSHGLKPSGPVMDFILRNHAFFSGGIFWLNSTTSDFLNGGLKLVNAVSPRESAERVLVVLDGVKSLPQSEELRPLLKNRNTRIIIISYSSQPPETLRREIDQQLIRGWSSISIQPLSTIHTTQRIVHSIVSRTHFTPLNREQKLLEKIAGLTAGCPDLITLTNAILQRCLEEAEEKLDVDFLDLFAHKVPMLSETHAELPSSLGEVTGAKIRSGSFKTNSYISQLITAFQLPPAHEFVLRTLSVFAPLPIPLSVVDIVQSLVMKATQGSMGPGRGVPNSISNLLSTMLLRYYPSPIICPPNNQSAHPHHILSSPLPTSIPKQTSFFCVPQLVQDSLWEDMEDTDIVFTITTAYKALVEFAHRPELGGSDLSFATGLAECIVAKCDSNRSCVDEGVYREAYRLLVNLQLKNI